MHSLNDSGIEPGHGQDRDLVDRGLVVVLVLSVALAVASMVMLFSDQAIGPPGFWGHGLLDHSSMVPMLWMWSAFAAGAVCQKRRQRAMRARNHPDPLEMPTWATAWWIVMTVLFGLDAYTRFHGSTWLDASEMVFGVLGLSAIVMGGLHRRRAHGTPLSARQKALLILMAIVAVVGILVLIPLTKWMP